jgi:hypothetical protein
MPERIQLRRVKGFKLAPNARSVARPGYYGNRYKVGDYYLVGDLLPFPVPTVLVTEGPAGDAGLRCVQLKSPARAVEWFRQWATAGGLAPAKVELLRGMDLACWCPLVDQDGFDVPCHADVLLELSNGGTA